MTIKESISVRMDAVENTHMHWFLDKLYHNALYWEDVSPRVNLLRQLSDWFGMDTPDCGFAEDSHEHVFVDAMLQGKTICAAAEMKEFFLEDGHYKKHFLRTLGLYIWAAIGNKSFNSNDPITRLSMMFTELDMRFDLFTTYGKKFLDLLKITSTSCATEDDDIAGALAWLTERIFQKITENDEKVELYEKPGTPIIPEFQDGEHECATDKLFIHHIPSRSDRAATQPAAEPEAKPAAESKPWYCEFHSFLYNVHIRTNATFGSKRSSNNWNKWTDEYLRNLTALIGYDITKGLNPENMDNDTISDKISYRFDDVRNDKVVLANIGSVLQICKMLATSQYPGQPGEGDNCDFDVLKFYEFVKKLYGVDLNGHGNWIKDYRFHVMSYLKGEKTV